MALSVKSLRDKRKRVKPIDNFAKAGAEDAGRRATSALRSRSQQEEGPLVAVGRGCDELEDFSEYSDGTPATPPVRYGGFAVSRNVHRVSKGLVAAAGLVVFLQLCSAMLEPPAIGITEATYDEFVLQRDPKTRRYGFVYSDTLVLTKVDRASPAFDAGLPRFIGRRINRVNGVPVRTKNDIKNTIIQRDMRSSLSQHITLSFAPILRVGSAVRALKRLVTRDGVTLPQGALGVVLRVPGYSPTSVAQVRIGGARFDATDLQIESVVEEDLVPHRMERAPTWIRRKSGEQDLKDIIESIGYARYDYLPRMIVHGLDRPDHVAAAKPSEVEDLGIKALHFKKIYQLSKVVVKERRRVERLAIAEVIASRDLLRLAELEEEMKRKAVEAEKGRATLAPVSNTTLLGNLTGLNLSLNGTVATNTTSIPTVR